MSRKISVSDLAYWCDPFEHAVWFRRVRRSDVTKALCAGRLNGHRKTFAADSISGNAARIAWFVTHGWKDAISVDVGVPSLGFFPSWLIEDGNHRFAAAVYRGDNLILAEISGETAYGRRLLPSPTGAG